MIEVTEEPISPELVIDKARNDSSGCVVAYVGLIRKYSQGKAVLSVQYEDSQRNAESFDKMLKPKVPDVEDVSKMLANGGDLNGGAQWTERRTFALAFRLAT